MIGALIAVGFLAVLIAVGVIAGYTHYVNHIDYTAKVGGLFDQADRASDITTKREYFDRYIAAIEREGLHEGCNSVFNCGMQSANNTEQFKVAKSLAARMSETAQLEGVARTYDMQTVIWTEFCWFPDHAFEQAYQMQHNGWGVALFPPGQQNNCATSSSSSTVRPPPPVG